MRGGEHRAPRRAARPTRLSAAAVAVLLAVGLVLGTQGTLAFWSDRATVTGGQLSSGTLDLTVDGAQGDPTPYAKTALAMTGMLPGESAAEVLTVRNAGSAPFTWVATASTGGGLGPHLVVTMSLGGTASPDDTTYPRTETCSGGTPVVSGATSTRLAAGAAGLTGQTLCVQVSLPSSTGNAAQGQPTGSVTVRLDATQAAS